MHTILAFLSAIGLKFKLSFIIFLLSFADSTETVRGFSEE